LLSGILLALGTMAVLAGMITVLGLLTIWTVVNLTAERLGAALLNVLYGPSMAGPSRSCSLTASGGLP